MMIEVSNETFRRLQEVASPLVDTNDTVIARLLDSFRANEKHGADSSSDPFVKVFGAISQSLAMESPKARKLDAFIPPDLKYTVVYGEIGGEDFRSWNDLVRIAHIKASKQGMSFEELDRVSFAMVRKGRFEQRGFHHVPEIDLSIQGVDANRAWKQALRLAQHLRLPIYVAVTWRFKAGATFPGETGILEWKPN